MGLPFFCMQHCLIYATDFMLGTKKRTIEKLESLRDNLKDLLDKMRDFMLKFIENDDKGDLLSIQKHISHLEQSLKDVNDLIRNLKK